jgi:phosphoesterase RecJ-like protein
LILKKSDILQLKTLLNESRNIVLLIHYNPDGDALGAALSLFHVFKSLNHAPQIISPNSIPSFLQWMPGAEHVIYAHTQSEKCKKAIENANILVYLDFNACHRLGNVLEPLCTASSAFKVLIDHHLHPEIPADITYSNIKTSSTSELVYHFIAKMMNLKPLINQAIAECIYVGMITDTGSLSFNCDHGSTYKILADLMRYNVDGEAIHRKIYDNFSENRMRLLGHCLLNRMKVFKDFPVAYIWLDKKDLRDFDYRMGDTEGVVNYSLSIGRVKFAALIIEREDRIKLSFRSKGNFDVNKFARAHFSGGGHKNAAGADSFTSLEKTIEIFEQALPLYQDEFK